MQKNTERNTKNIFSKLIENSPVITFEVKQSPNFLSLDKRE